MSEIKKEYKNDDITIVWEPGKCIHSGICARDLPSVFKPKERPWITMNTETTERLKEQVKNCPSGALSYYLNSQKTVEMNKETEINVIKGGPLRIHGDLKVVDADGNVELKTNVTGFCRCGHSKNKPYCDGAHKSSDFND